MPGIVKALAPPVVRRSAFWYSESISIRRHQGNLIKHRMKKFISFFVALAVPLLAACGSSDAAAEAAPSPEPTAAAAVQPAGCAQPRWSPPEEKPVAADAVPAVAEEHAADTPAEADVPQKQAYFHAGVPNKEILEILGKPDRSELGANSRHLYNNCEYNGILFKSIEVDMTNDGTAFLIVLVADGSIDLGEIKAFMQDWADALQTDNGTPGITQMEDPIYVNYDWSNESLQVTQYPNDPDYHIGLVWKLF